MAVPYTFGTTTSAIPLSQLDSNFATAVTIGNTAVQLGNTVTTLNNMTLANVTISSGNVTITTANVSSTTNTSSLVVTGNQTFVGTGNRITGDFSNATASNSVSFQSSTTNGRTALQVLPNGTNAFSNIYFFNNSTPTNASYALFGMASTSYTFIDSNKLGTGTALPIVFLTSAVEKMRIDTSGFVGIGTSTASAKLQAEYNIATYSANLKVSNTNFGTGAIGEASGLLTVATDMNNIAFYTASDLGVSGTSVPTNERMRINQSGLVGIGTASPSSLLTLAAGTATASTSPLKFTSGTNLTTPEAGAVEYDGTVFYGTTDTNFKRGTLPITNYTSGTGTALGTNTEATLAVLLPSANDTITLSVGTYFLDISFIITRGPTSTTSATARLNLLGTGNAVGSFSGMSLSAPTASGATANFSFDAVNINVSNVLTAASTTAAGVYTMSLRGIMKITTSGTIIPQYNLSANINAAGTVAKVLYFRLQQLDTQSAAAAGPAGTGWA
jgi:hypothetical protein